MKKSLIAAAVAAGMAASMAASADVATYAQVYVGIDSVDNGTTSVVEQDDNTGRGRLGFKTSEELGGGMTAFAKVEYQIDINDTIPAGGVANSNLKQRTGIAGLKAGWGAISAGRMPGAYKMAGGVTFDPFVTTALDARKTGMAHGAYAQNGFISQMVQYKSPKISGFQVAYQTSVLNDDDDTKNTGSEGDALYSITYTGVKGLKLIYASAKQGGCTVGDGTATSCGEAKVNTKFGAKYKINDAMNVAFQSESTEAATNPGDYTYFNINYKMGKHNFTLANGSADLDNGNTNEYMAIGDTIKLSKQTRVIIGYGTTNQNSAAKDTTIMTVGLRKDF